MASWTYLGGMGHKQFTTETAGETERAIRDLEQWMNRQATSVLVKCKGEPEAHPVSLSELRATDPKEIEEVFVVPRMAGG